MSDTAKLDAMARSVEKDFFWGSIRLHILHDASHGKVFRAGLMEELRRHGYQLSPGTLYPILHALERGSYLKSRVQMVGGRRRRNYVATTSARKALRASRPRILELVAELFEESPSISQKVWTPRVLARKGTHRRRSERCSAMLPYTWER